MIKTTHRLTVHIDDLERALIKAGICNPEEYSDIRYVMFGDSYYNDTFIEYNVESVIEDYEFYVNMQLDEQAEKMLLEFKIAVFIQENLWVDKILVDVSW